MLERNVQRACLEWLAAHGIYAWRQNQGAIPLQNGGYRRFSGLKGVSDILGITNDGRFLAIEVKGPHGKMSKDQEDFQQAIADRGGVATCVRSVDELERDLREEGVI